MIFKYGLLLSVCLSLTVSAADKSSSSSSGSGGIFLRGSLFGGAWTSRFRQSGFGQTSMVDKGPTSGVGATLGLATKGFPLFLELEYISLMVGTPKSKNYEEAKYSGFGLIVGFGRQGFPFEPFVGVESGKYSFENGPPIWFEGSGLVSGLNIVFAPKGNVKYGIRGEYRYIVYQKDSSGEINTAYSTSALIYSAGLFVGFGLD